MLTWFHASIRSCLCAPDRITGIIALDPVMLDWVAILPGSSGADQRVRGPTVAGCWLIKEIQSFPELPHEHIFKISYAVIIANITIIFPYKWHNSMCIGCSMCTWFIIYVGESLFVFCAHEHTTFFIINYRCQCSFLYNKLMLHPCLRRKEVQHKRRGCFLHSPQIRLHKTGNCSRLIYQMCLWIELATFYMFVSVYKIPWKDKKQQQMHLLTSIVCITAWYIFFLWATELHCCPETIKNTSVSHIVALGDMFLHYCERTHCSFFWLSLRYTVLLPQILTRAPNPQLKIVPNKCTIYCRFSIVLWLFVSSCFRKWFSLRIQLAADTSPAAPTLPASPPNPPNPHTHTHDIQIPQHRATNTTMMRVIIGPKLRRAVLFVVINVLAC